MEYMSQGGYDEHVAELRELELVELPRVRDAIAEARVPAGTLRLRLESVEL